MNKKKRCFPSSYIFCTFAILALTGCLAEQPDRPIDIGSEGGGGEFYTGEKPETDSGEIADVSPPIPAYDDSCPGAMDSHLQIGDTARVIIYQLSARSAPGFESPQEHVLAEGRVVEIVNGPKCADSAWWWEIHFAGTVSSGEYLDYFAWMVEVDYDTYYLQKTN